MPSYKNHIIEILYDRDPMNPRTEFDNLGTMCCTHKRYQLGDKDTGYSLGAAGSWAAEEAAISAKFDVAVILPIYMYDHSGQTVQTTPFSCPWDSGQIGFIWVSKEKARKEYGWKVLTKARLAKLTEYLVGEVKTFDQYLRGDVYGYKILDQDGDEVDSCWGFFGEDHEKSGLLESARGYIDSVVGPLGVQLELALGAP